MRALFELLSKEKDLANAIAAVASALTALIALFVSLWALHIQRRHNVLSIRPIPEVTVADYEDSLRVKLRNNGSGPLIVASLEVFNGSAAKGSVIEWMPTLPGNRPWNHFSMALERRTIQPDGVVPLLELTAGEGEPQFDAPNKRIERSRHIFGGGSGRWRMGIKQLRLKAPPPRAVQTYRLAGVPPWKIC
jgi:hypothetical protein